MWTKEDQIHGPSQFWWHAPIVLICTCFCWCWKISQGVVVWFSCMQYITRVLHIMECYYERQHCDYGNGCAKYFSGYTFWWCDLCKWKFYTDCIVYFWLFFPYLAAHHSLTVILFLQLCILWRKKRMFIMSAKQIWCKLLAVVSHYIVPGIAY